MKKLHWLPLLVMLTGCVTSYRLVGTTRDLPAGTVLQASDLERLDDTKCEHWAWADSEQYTTDASQLIGRKILVPIPKNQLINKEYTIGIDGVYSESWKRREAAVRRAAAQHQ